jgi:rod shape-determining protein MreD
MSKRRLVSLIFICVILQITIVPYFKIFGIKPDLILSSIVIVSLFCDLKLALGLSILAGAFKDIFGANTLAINSLASGAWSLLVIKLSRRIAIDINLSRAGLIFIIAILNAFVMRIFFWYLGTYVPLGIFLRISFLDSLYTALVSLLVFRVLKIK